MNHASVTSDANGIVISVDYEKAEVLLQALESFQQKMQEYIASGTLPTLECDGVEFDGNASASNQFVQAKAIADALRKAGVD